MAPDFGGKPFSLVHYLSVKSAVELNKPAAAFFPDFRSYYFSRFAEIDFHLFVGFFGVFLGVPLRFLIPSCDVYSQKEKW
jgi:hypothetical protein